MKSQTSRILSRATRLACVAAATAGLAAVSTLAAAQSVGPLRAANVYGGLAYGVQVRTGCDGAASCERGGASVKLFGGYRMTPNLATEVSYFYLGNQDRSWGPGSKPSYAAPGVISQIDSQHDKTHALGLGVNLETELFSWMTNHLRVGLAVSQTKSELVLANGTQIEKTKERVFPYAGVGASAALSPYVRLLSGVDVLFNPDRTYVVLTVGVGGEF